MNWRYITVVTLLLANPVNTGIVSDVINGLVQAQETQQVQAEFTVTPTYGQVPLTVQFDASASTGSNLTYEWGFGDGTTGNGVNVNHNYAEAGVYPVTLTISQGATTSTTSQTVFAQSVQDNGLYTLETNGVIVGMDGVTIVDRDELTKSKNFTITEAPPQDPSTIRNLERGNAKIISKFYEISSPTQDHRKNNSGDGLLWIGLPLPEGVDPNKVTASIETKTSEASHYNGARIWFWNNGYYDAERNMFFFYMTVGTWSEPDESVVFVLQEATVDVDRIEEAPGPFSSVSTPFTTMQQASDNNKNLVGFLERTLRGELVQSFFT